jgi:hypothetical protein
MVLYFFIVMVVNIIIMPADYLIHPVFFHKPYNFHHSCYTSIGTDSLDIYNGTGNLMNVMILRALVGQLNSCVGDDYKLRFYYVFISCSSPLS